MPPGRSAVELNHVNAGIYLAETHAWPGFKHMPMLTDHAAPERLGMFDTTLNMNYPPLSVDAAPAKDGARSFAGAAFRAPRS